MTKLVKRNFDVVSELEARARSGLISLEPGITNLACHTALAIVEAQLQTNRDDATAWRGTGRVLAGHTHDVKVTCLYTVSEDDEEFLTSLRVKTSYRNMRRTPGTVAFHENLARGIGRVCDLYRPLRESE